MKKTVRIMSFLLSLLMIMGVATSLAVAAPAAITGAGQVTTSDIMIGNIDTGLDLTQMILTKGTSYAKGNTGLLNVIEIPAKAENITMAVLNGGSANWSKETIGSAAVKYNTNHKDGTIIAAVNGDPWLVYHTDYDGDGQGSTGPSVKHVSVSRGLQIIDGEIWASRQTDDENNLHKAEERGTAASHGPTFGVLPDGTYIIGKPVISFKAQNTTKNSAAVVVNGINRLAAPNSLMVYNQRCGSESFAYEDAYEVYVKCDSTAFNLSTAVTGKVTAIFKSGDKATRPAIDANTIVLSARGNAISRLDGKYAVGDSVSVSCSLTSDNMDRNQKDKWLQVTDAISGFFTLLEKGRETGQPGNTTKYPCSVIGLKEDGTAVMVSTTPDVDGTRSACNMEDLPDMLKELGVYTAILFDGGGSTTMVTLSGDKYVRRSSAVDGNNSVRSVINGLAIVYKGVDINVTNAETKNTAFLPDSDVTPPAVDEPTDNNGADLTCEPSYAYRYMASVDSINGKTYEALQGMRDPNYASSWTAEEKLASIKPATTNDVTVSDSNTIVLAGWAIVNGGQQKHYYSLDKENWYLCEGTFTDAEAAVITSAQQNGNVTAPSAENGHFSDLTVDLSAHKGETVTVYMAVEAGSSGKLCHYLTIENVAVPADEVATDAPTTDETGEPEVDTTEPSDETTVETETTVEEVTDEATVEETQAPADETQAPAKESGCSMVAGSGVALLVLMGGAYVCLRKKED